MRSSVRWVRLVLLVLGLALLRSAAAADPLPRGEKYALLVGINSYAPPFQNLSFCHNDVEELKKVLVAAGFPEENVFLMRDGLPQSRFYPSKANIERQLTLRLGLMEKDDLILIAFAGHGILEGATSYLCPCDAVIGSARETMISLDSLYERMQRCRASQRVLLVDACRREPLIAHRGPAGVRGFADEIKEPPKGVRVLSSCDVGQWSAEVGDKKHGAFMYYVIEGLQGAADREGAGNRNGQVSLEELYDYAYHKTKKHVANLLGLPQTPVMKGEFSGTYEIARVGQVAPAAPPVAAPPANEVHQPPGPILPLLQQAETYRRGGQFDKAVDVYTHAVGDTTLDVQIRRRAFEGRALAYLAKGTRESVEKALVDYLAAGKSAMPMSIVVPTADLMIESEVKATLTEREVVAITRIDAGGDWLWVESVGGDTAKQGYLPWKALLKPEPDAAPQAARQSAGGQDTGTFRGQTANAQNQPQVQGSSGGLAGARNRHVANLESQLEDAQARGQWARTRVLQNELRTDSRLQDGLLRNRGGTGSLRSR